MKILKKATSFLIAISIILTNSSYIFALEESKPEESVKIPSRSIYTHEKIIGRDRYETGRMTLEESKRFDNIIVVNGIEEKLVDGLCASSLVEKLNASILPINPNRVDKKSMEYINKAKNVYIIGENQAIPYSFEESIDKKVNVTRIGGKDRFETSEKIAKYLGNYDKAYIVNGIKGEADAMSISSVAARDKNPVILTKKSSAEIDKKDGVEYTVIGGNEVVSDEVLSNYSARRIGGETRYETNREVLEKFYPGRKVRYFTNGETLVDALSAASLSKNDGITFINRRKNHDLLKCIDTVQVGGFPYEIIFTNEGCGGSGGNGGGTVIPPSKPDKPVDPDKPTEPLTPIKHRPTEPEAKSEFNYEYNDKGEGLVYIKITEESTDEDTPKEKISYQYSYNEKDIVDVDRNLKFDIGYHPVGEGSVKVRAIDEDQLVSEWVNVSFEVKEKKTEPLTPIKHRPTEPKTKVEYGEYNNDGKCLVKITAKSTDEDTLDENIHYEYLYNDNIISEENYYPVGKHIVKVRAVDNDGLSSLWVNVEVDVVNKEEIGESTLCSGIEFNKRVKKIQGYNDIKIVKFIRESTSKDFESYTNLGQDKQDRIYGYIEDKILYISSNDKIYANLDSSCMFIDVTKVEEINLNNFDTSRVQNMSYMFYYCTNLKNLDLSNFDTSKVTTMEFMFYYCTNLEKLNVSNFNTSNVTTMEYMFIYCKELVSIDVSSFNTSNVITMHNMFTGCASLTGLDLSSFNTSKVTTMESMFKSCISLVSIDVSSFNTSNVITMQDMFAGCASLTGLDLSSFNTSKVTTMQDMFAGCASLTGLDLSSFNTSNVNNMASMFQGCTLLDSPNLSSFDTSKVTTMTWMFEQCEKLENLDVSSFNTSKVTTMYGMFRGCVSLERLDLSKFNTSSVTSFTQMFYGCVLLNEIKGLDKFNTSNVENMSHMFFDCKKLEGEITIGCKLPSGRLEVFSGCSKEINNPFLVNYKPGFKDTAKSIIYYSYDHNVILGKEKK